MLKGALRRLDHPQYRIFVGVYPNDPDTIEAVRRVADPRVIPVFTSRPGPTTKADCLNHPWNALTREGRTEERRVGQECVRTWKTRGSSSHINKQKYESK